MKQNARRWGLLASAAVVAAAIWLASALGTSANSQLTLASVTADKLSAHGIMVSTANGRPSTTQVQALNATRQSEGTDFGPPPAIRQVVLARVVRPASRIDCLCWAVSLDPSGFRPILPYPGAGQAVYTFYVAFVDARTGQWLMTDAGQ